MQKQFGKFSHHQATVAILGEGEGSDYLSCWHIRILKKNYTAYEEIGKNDPFTVGEKETDRNKSQRKPKRMNRA